MYMSEEIICKEYRTAKNQKNQIKILAQLNGTDTKVIKSILIKHGELKADNNNDKDIKKEEKVVENTDNIEENYDGVIFKNKKFYFNKDFKEKVSDAIRNNISLADFKKNNNYDNASDKLQSSIDSLYTRTKFQMKKAGLLQPNPPKSFNKTKVNKKDEIMESCSINDLKVSVEDKIKELNENINKLEKDIEDSQNKLSGLYEELSNLNFTYNFLFNGGFI